MLDGGGADAQIGRLDLIDDARDLFGLRADNIFMRKMTYWLNP